MKTPLEKLLYFVHEIGCQYQTLEMQNWPAMGIIEEYWLDELGKAYINYKKSLEKEEITCKPKQSPYIQVVRK